MPTPDVIQELIRKLESRSEILEAYVFGSMARGDSSAHSDVDVAVFVDAVATPTSSFGYQADLAAELMTAIGRSDVDVVVLNEAPPLLYHRVLRDGRRIVSRDLAATTTREGRALSRYCDYLNQLRKIDIAHATRIDERRFGK